MRAETSHARWEAWLRHSGRQGQMPWREPRAPPSRQWHSAALLCQLLLAGFLGLVSVNTGKCTLIPAWPQPHSLSNEETGAGSRSKSRGDLPMVEYPFLWPPNCWENILSLSVVILLVHIFCFRMPVLDLGSVVQTISGVI